MMFGIGLNDEARKAAAIRDTAVALGLLGTWIPLNGGSDTRRDIRDGYRENARSLRIEFRQHGGHAVSFGGPFHAGRGRRYLSMPDRLTWVHWRKAKKLVRKGKASPP